VLNDGPSASSASDALLAWYNTFVASFADTCPDLKIKYMGIGVFECTYSIECCPPEKDMEYHKANIEPFVNPDKDGVRPMKFGDSEYSVTGKLLMINDEFISNDINYLRTDPPPRNKIVSST
jgi:hypothetical protein